MEESRLRQPTESRGKQSKKGILLFRVEIHKPFGQHFRHFCPPSLYILLNRAYVVILTFLNPPPLPCSHDFLNDPLFQST